MSYFGDFQNDIYREGLRGVQPRLPVDFDSLEQKAQGTLPVSVISYVQGGCGDEFTQRRNAEAFHYWGLIPRMMVDCSTRDLTTEIFGLKLAAPVLLSPIGVLGPCTPDGHGDLHVARASTRARVPMIASTLSNDSLECVRENFDDTPGFSQLYTPKSKELAESLVHRLVVAGYRAIVVTLDTWVTGWRPRDLNAGNFPRLRGHVLKNYFIDPAFRAMPPKAPDEDLTAAVGQWAQTFGKVRTWADMPWLRSLTTLPLILKGICHPDDARRAMDAGVDGIYCSNHGGRQANGGAAAMDMLPAIVEASGATPVLFDSGMRSGSDIVKGLAMGAAAAGIGRPYVYGLALDGEAGVIHVLRSMLAEADLLMAVDGFHTLSTLRSAGVVRV